MGTTTTTNNFPKKSTNNVFSAICRLSELLYPPDGELLFTLIQTMWEDFLIYRTGLQEQWWGAGQLQANTHSCSHLGAAKNDRTLALLTTEQINQSSRGLSTPFNGTSTAAIEGGKNTIYVFPQSLYTQWEVQANAMTFMM